MSGASKLAEFPVASLKSRAAARILLKQKQSKQERVQFLHRVRGPWRDEGTAPVDVPRANPWVECSDGKLFRMIYRPHIWIGRGEAAPVCPGCGTPYRKGTDYPNYPFVGYGADCMDKHIPDFSSPL